MISTTRCLIGAGLGLAVSACGESEFCDEAPNLAIGDAILTDPVHSPAQYTGSWPEGPEHQARLAHLDADGNVDLVVYGIHDCLGGMEDSHFPVIAIRGDGAGGFGAVVEVDGLGACDVDVGDLDGDGQDEVVVSRIGETRVFFDAMGGSPPAAVLEKGGAITVGDVDADGTMDLIVAQGTDVAWFGEDGSGGFEVRGELAVETSAADIAVGRFGDRPGLDLAVGGRQGDCGPECNLVSIHNQFSDPNPPPPEEVRELWRYPVRLATSDLDGQGNEELTVDLLGHMFDAFTRWGGAWAPDDLPHDERIYMDGKVVGDVDGDGTMDLVEFGSVFDGSEDNPTSPWCGALALLAGHRNGTEMRFERTDVFTREAWLTTGAVIGDVNGDDVADLVLIVHDPDTGPASVMGIRVLLGRRKS